MSGGETLYTNGYCHYLPAVVHKMDPGILAQQSDVRCNRGRIGIIMARGRSFYPSRLKTSGPSSLLLRGARLPSTVCKPGGCS